MPSSLRRWVMRWAHIAVLAAAMCGGQAPLQPGWAQDDAPPPDASATDAPTGEISSTAPMGTPTGAQIMALVRADRWPEALAAAQAQPDPVAVQLVTFYRLIAPNAASVPEIDDFLAARPDWPLQSVLIRRRDEALAHMPDDPAATAQIVAACGARRPHASVALVRCAQADQASGATEAAQRALRDAWLNLAADPVAESAFLSQWAAALRPEDDWQRFDRVIWLDTDAAARLLPRLDPAHQTIAQVRLALRRDVPTVPGPATVEPPPNPALDQILAQLTALPQDQRTDPAMLFEHARALRRAHRTAQAQTLWLGPLSEAAPHLAPAHQAALWQERGILARYRLAQGDAAGAYALMALNGPSGAAAPGAAAETSFLAGWIALQRLHDLPRARAHFTELDHMSHAAITQGRAHYWLGRVAEAEHTPDQARAEYTAAAQWATTYYGQLAALRLGETPPMLNTRLQRLRDPVWTQDQALRFAGRELARAAALLVSWNEPRRARVFLARLNEIAPDAADKALNAHLALGLGLPDQAVTAARQAGAEGVMLPEAGWPMAFNPPSATAQTTDTSTADTSTKDASAQSAPMDATDVDATGIDGSDGRLVDPALVLGIARQESSFDSQAESPAGARGLMQLMPATARMTAQRIGQNVTTAALTADPELNIRLGAAYLRQLGAQFSALPLMVAAYNAGPTRVQDWLATNGDPRLPTPSAAQIQPQAQDWIDWIELIPFPETRNYVQRVVENLTIYRALRNEASPSPVISRP